MGDGPKVPTGNLVGAQSLTMNEPYIIILLGRNKGNLNLGCYMNIDKYENNVNN